MKCKSCGQELKIDNQTKVAVCVGCGKKYAINTTEKAKKCKVCNVELVNKEAYLQCPSCGKKYALPNKKNENSRVDNEDSKPLNQEVKPLNQEVKEENINIDNEVNKPKPHNNIDNGNLLNNGKKAENTSSAQITRRENIRPLQNDNTIIPVLNDDMLETEDNNNLVETEKNNQNKPLAFTTQPRIQSKKSNGASPLFKIIGIVFGILSVLFGIVSYILAQFSSIEKIANLSIGSMLPTLQKVSVILFLVFFAVIMIIATLKDIGLKRIGTIACILFSVILILSLCFEKQLGNKALSGITYSGFAVLLIGSFLTMVISCQGSLSKPANIMGIVFFAFSLVSLLVASMQLLPLNGLGLGALESVKGYFKDLDKLLLGFASISAVALICKSK